jgi:hypothetical protein
MFGRAAANDQRLAAGCAQFHIIAEADFFGGANWRAVAAQNAAAQVDGHGIRAGWLQGHGVGGADLGAGPAVGGAGSFCNHRLAPKACRLGRAQVGNVLGILGTLRTARVWNMA